MRKKEIENQEHRHLNRSLWSNLQSLKSTVSFMQTGAHPDDEASRLLAKLSLDDGYHVSYINAVRGQGGQNSIGAERDDSLGALRTIELLKAMSVLRVDIGWLADNRDSTINDFGLSKSAEETFGFWGKEHTIKRMILMVRAYKPDIIIPTFLDVNGQHGHHRAVTRATIEAYETSNKKDIYPDINFKPWKISQIFLPAWGGGGGSYDDEEAPPKASHWIEIGNFNNIFGGTYNQIGEWSRSYHATQNIGQLALEDNLLLPLHLLKGKFVEGDITGGLVPRNLWDLSEFARDKNGKQNLIEAHKYSEEAIANFNSTELLIKSLCKLKTFLESAEKSISKEHVHRVKLKQKQCSAAMADCISLLPNLSFNSGFHFFGGKIKANLSIHKNDTVDLTQVDCNVITPFKTDLKFKHKANISSNRIDYTFEGLISQNESYQDLYQQWHGIALEPTGVHASVDFKVNNTSFSISVMPNSNLSVIPDIISSLETNKILNIINNDNQNNKFTKINVKFLVNKFSNHETNLQLIHPKNYICNNTSINLKNNNNFEGILVSTEIQIPTLVDEGLGKIYFSSNDKGLSEISEFGYKHTGKILFENKSELSILNIKVESLSGLKIGWIDGYADNAWKWAKMLGADVKLLSDEEIISEDFSKFDTIVTGVFAGASRPIHKVFNKINKWINDGGNYVTEYQRPQDNWDESKSSPYFLKIGSPSIRWRVTNPRAEVGFLDPDHLLLNSPNKITPRDFDNWVKERGLYFASKWDENYKPLFMMSDDNEQPLLGGLLVTDYGKGRYIHCALNLFYQMDSLVPGAFRMFANILKS